VAKRKIAEAIESHIKVRIPSPKQGNSLKFRSFISVRRVARQSRCGNGRAASGYAAVFARHPGDATRIAVKWNFKPATLLMWQV
jgi:hypothetical protein